MPMHKTESVKIKYAPFPRTMTAVAITGSDFDWLARGGGARGGQLKILHLCQAFLSSLFGKPDTQVKKIREKHDIRKKIKRAHKK